ncbi:hypothetical protein JANAI62_27820 [Jannaschia pagri]|uniref:Uncharacterized protein n=1 Tax=Jannaschia pagri TaxID=2829797 RepID=A0ABQ4NP39_9RHOB|nr:MULTISPECIES: hypothetical protein [unclassified Jannaschia]GIT92324.1 hypothetical protein JANAI61_27820 [Jannaschia sp. AI_61]GIT96159.1 hypothetical protein JANAI62_27820 [Jannaschia sp. AI_62]
MTNSAPVRVDPGHVPLVVLGQAHAPTLCPAYASRSVLNGSARACKARPCADDANPMLPNDRFDASAAPAVGRPKHRTDR